MFSFNIRNKARMSALIPSIQHCTSGSSQDNYAKKKKKKKREREREKERKEKEIKGTQIGKEEVKLYLKMT